jgi:uncharacterized protein (DUF4415 family)
LRKGSGEIPIPTRQITIKAVLVVPRRKEAISIRLDDDVLSYFKSLGAGYQTRINAVLRHFMEQARAKRK